MRIPIALVGATLVVALTMTAGLGQIVTTRIYSRPQVPSDEVLKRLNLNLAWKRYIPMAGQRDGINRIEIVGKDLFVLSRSGQIARIDAESGKIHWRTRIGKPYTLLPFFAANFRSVYVIANVELFSLDRATGIKKWQYRLPAGVSAGPIVDEQQIYIPATNSRLYAFYLPFVGIGEEQHQKGSEPKSSTYSVVYGIRDATFERRPRPTWVEQTNINLTFRPLQTADVVFVNSREGRAFGFSKVAREGASSTELYRLSTEGQIRLPPGQFGDTAYLGSDDAALYAVNMVNGKLRWRHTAGSAITRRPIAVEKDVYVTSEREGMARIDRASGDSVWRVPCGRRVLDSNREADEFLAANTRFVYAADRSGRLLILDRKRGVRLSMFDTTAFRVKVVNEVTDRLYLAAQDGLIVCLHDRDQKEPLRHRRRLEDANSPILKLLEQPISAPPGKPAPLRDVLAQMRQKYKLKFVVAEQAFKVAGDANVQDRNVATPAADKRPLKDYLQRTLNQVKATYQVVDETILIIPGKGK